MLWGCHPGGEVCSRVEVLVVWIACQLPLVVDHIAIGLEFRVVEGVDHLPELPHRPALGLADVVGVGSLR